MPRSVWRLILPIVLLAVPQTLLAQPAFLIQDFNTAGVSPSMNPASDFTVLGTTLFFAHTDGIHGYELWKSDGTAAGTSMLIDICPGFCSSLYDLTVSNGSLFLLADDGVHGIELWKSDGTAAGTSMVKDVYPGRAQLSFEGTPRGLLDVNGVLYFAANDREHGLELWKSDGTPGGTVLVRDIRPGPDGSGPRTWAAGDGALLLNADDGIHGREPWVSDGTAAGTILARDISPGSASSTVLLPSLLDGELDAIAAPGGGFLFQAGGELWKTNGTEAGTVLVKNINVFDDSSPSGFEILGSAVYFSAFEESHGRELWKTDGTAAGTILVKDINPGEPSSNPAELAVSGGRLFFRATDATYGTELWVSDGVGAGTLLVKDIAPGDFPGLWLYANAITPFGEDILFIPFGHGRVWRSDGTEAGTVPLPGDSHQIINESFTISRAVVGSTFYFSSFGPSQGTDSELWKSDGNSTEIIPLAPTAPWAFRPEFRTTTGVEDYFGAQGGRLLFSPAQGNDAHLWASDATPGGTAVISDSPGYEFTPAGGLTFMRLGFGLATTDGTSAGTQGIAGSLPPAGEKAALGSSILYVCGSPSFPPLVHGLCKSDGTPAGTGLVAQIPTDVNPFQLTASGSKVFFIAGDSLTGQELWKSDGTENGTLLVRDIRPDGEGSFPDRLTDVAGTLFFSAATEGEGRELWKSDGTEGGTVLVKDIRPGPGSSIDRTGEGVGDETETWRIDWGGATAAVGARLFFIADDGTSGSELWTSDGTAAGTVLVKDVMPGPLGSEPFELTRVGNRVFFSADDGIHGRELWVSDGTAAGTRMVADIFPGAGSSVPQELQAVGHVLLFAATDSVHNLEAWRSNGTAAGTRMIQDIAPGALASSPVSFISSGSHVFFLANDGVTGMEPWAVPRSNVLATFSDVPTGFWAWPYVEALAGAGLTGGCAPGQFCPETNVSRAETAVFLVRGTRGLDFVPPPATGMVFQDVPAGYWAAPWIEQFAADGFTSGCSLMPPLYCPAQPLNRDEMAVFLLKARHGSTYTPPPATGTVFQDVPASYWAAPWIEQLAAEGITAGCATGFYCPGDPVNRAQMAVFLTRTFNLPLP